MIAEHEHLASQGAELVELRLDFIKGDISDYSAYVNIGGGVSSMGVGGNKLLDQKTGIIYSEEVIKKDLDKCVVSEFADAGVILINIHKYEPKTHKIQNACP